MRQMSLFSSGKPVDEVDERTVVRPDRKVVVEAFPRHIDLARPTFSSGSVTNNGSPSAGGWYTMRRPSGDQSSSEMSEMPFR